MRRILAALAILLIVALTTWAFMPRPVAVETDEVALRDLEVTIEEEGEARIREVYTVSASIAGRLGRIGLHAGDPVEAGKTIVASIGPAAPALLDSRARAVAEAAMSAATAAVDLAQAQVAQAEASLEFMTAELTRSHALFEKAAIPLRLLENARLGQSTAQSALDSARANLALRLRELDSARAVLGLGTDAQTTGCCVELVAPVSGRVLRVLTENEQVVPTGTPILEIGDPQNLEVVVDLLSRDAVQLREGADAEITDWGGLPIKAKVARIEPLAVPQVSALGIEERRVEVVLALEGDPQSWRQLGHGFRVVAHITRWHGEGVLTVPVGALFRDGPDWATFVLRDGRARLQRITLGERNDAFAEVTAGLAAGDEVILHPNDQITEGTRASQ